LEGAEVAAQVAKEARESAADFGLGDGFRLVSGMRDEGGQLVAEGLRAGEDAYQEELDAADFDAIEYLNRHFPTEASLTGGRLEGQLKQWDWEISKIDEEVLDAVRDQAMAGSNAARDIDHARDCISDLMDKAQGIKARADEADQMAEDICKDVRELDTAKSNLMATASTVKRLQLLTSSLSQLQRCIAEREYTGAGTALGVAGVLVQAFEEYKAIPVMGALRSADERVRMRLRGLMAEDFEMLTEDGTAAAMHAREDDDDAPVAGAEEAKALIKKLNSACEVVDALGGECLADRVSALIRKTMRPYLQQFSTPAAMDGEGPGTLAMAERRFAWFRRAIRDLDVRYGSILPKRWRLQHRFCVAFCEQTRTDFERQLAAYDPPDSAPPEALLRALQKSLEFERQMAARFEEDASRTARASSLTGGGLSARPGEEDSEDDLSEEEPMDSSAPLVNEEGEVLDPKSAAGIRVKYRRAAEWKENIERRRQARVARAAQRKQLRDLSAHLGGDPGAITGGSLDLLPAIPPLRRLIAAAFDPNMGAYIKLEKQRLVDAVHAAGANVQVDSAAALAHAEKFLFGTDDIEEEEAVTSRLFSSSTKLFGLVRGAIDRCGQINTGQTMFSMFREAKWALEQYADMLEKRVPKPLPGNGPLGALPARTDKDKEKAKTYATPTEANDAATTAFSQLCLVVTTAEYCGETSPLLAELVRPRIDKEFVEHVETEDLGDRFYEIAANATHALAGWTWSILDYDLQTMIKTDWYKLSQTGDQSPFVLNIALKLRALVPRARVILTPAYFRQFCEHFVRGFMHRFMACVYKPRSGVGEIGGQQLLLDTQVLKAFLIDVPTLRTKDEEERELVVKSPPASYTRFVKAEMPRLEMLLKLLSAPKAVLAITVGAIWPNVSRAEIERVMSLRMMSKHEMAPVLAELGLDGSAPSAAPAPAGPVPEAADAAAATGAPGTPSTSGMGAALSMMGKGITGAVGGLAKLGRSTPSSGTAAKG
jgi:vacuolar protein sorting-associated protein 53